MANQRDLLSSIVARVWTRRDIGTRGTLVGHATWTGTFLIASSASFTAAGVAGVWADQVFLVDFPGTNSSSAFAARVDEVAEQAGFVLLERTDHLSAGLDIPFFLDPPSVGSICRTAFSAGMAPDARLLQFSGPVGSVRSNGFTIDLPGASGAFVSDSTARAGAPVLVNGALAGILTNYTRKLGGEKDAVEMRVLSLASMSESKTSDSVRTIVRHARVKPSGIEDGTWIGPDVVSAVQGPEEQSAGRVASGNVDQEASQNLWERLSRSGRYSLARAEGIRERLRAKQLLVEHLIAGLFPSWERFFLRAGVGKENLTAIIDRESGVVIPELSPIPAHMKKLPPLSEGAGEALMQAARYADERGAKLIWSTHLLYGVLSVKGSKTVEALRELGIRREDIRPEDAEITDTPAQDEAPQDLDGGSFPERLDDASAFSRLSVSSRNAFGRADGIRLWLRQPAVHMEHLITALFDKPKGPAQRLLEGVGINRSKLQQIIRETVGTEMPLSYGVSELTQLPEMSGHVRDAVRQAARRAESAGLIRSRHLLYGALAVDECKVVQALTKLGVNKDLIVLDEEDDVEEGRGAAQDVKQERQGSEAVRSAPTPKVDSDLWAEQDRLGYEAYARTIAALITHKDTKAPLTIGIKAPWGAGKTSLMKRVQHLLDGRAELSEENRSGARQMGQAARMTLWELRRELKKITKGDQGTLKAEEMPKLPTPSNTEGLQYGLPPRITVWFNAWKYQTSEQIWAGMAHCIISQVTARMTPLERELFWLRLHARRINTDEVRRKIHELLLRMFVPAALVIVVVCAVVFWVAMALRLSLPWRWTIQGFAVLSGLIGVIWKARETLGEKAAGTMKELVREPDYEGKMGYLHLVESDIREVLNLVTEAGVTETPTGAKAPASSGAEDAAPKGRSSTKSPLVVFVDDLDRCAPNKVAEVVEAINLFLCGDYPNCMFVLGMEPGMVAAALEVANKEVIEKAKQMGVVDSTAPVGWRFMEKIVQMPIMIPPPTKGGRDAYVTSLVGAARNPETDQGKAAPGEGVSKAPPAPSATRLTPSAPPKEEDVQKYAQRMTGGNLAEVEKRSLEIVAAAPANEKQAAAEAGKRAYAEAFSERDPMIADFVQECAALVDGNPRQIKRYVNVFRFYSTLRYGLRADGVATESELPSDKVLAKFVSLSIQWPHAMDCLRGTHHTESNGRAVSRLEFLETESAKNNTDDVAGDDAWKKVVGTDGLGLEPWAHARAFRLFLSRGSVSLGKSGGHGLW